MTVTMKREMNIAAEMHYENNVFAFARHFDLIGKGYDEKNKDLARIGMSGV